MAPKLCHSIDPANKGRTCTKRHGHTDDYCRMVLSPPWLNPNRVRVVPIKRGRTW